MIHIFLGLILLAPTAVFAGKLGDLTDKLKQQELEQKIKEKKQQELNDIRVNARQYISELYAAALKKIANNEDVIKLLNQYQENAKNPTTTQQLVNHLGDLVGIVRSCNNKDLVTICRNMEEFIYKSTQKLNESTIEETN